MVNFLIHLIILYINSNYEVEIKINEKTLPCARCPWRTAKNVCREPRSQTHGKVELGQTTHLTGPAHHPKPRYKLAASSPHNPSRPPQASPFSVPAAPSPPSPAPAAPSPPSPASATSSPSPPPHPVISRSGAAGRRLPPLPPRRRWLTPRVRRRAGGAPASSAPHPTS
jgi:hypothetical protein